MTHDLFRGPLLAAALCLAGAALPLAAETAAAADASSPAGDPVHGQQIFQRCGACHFIDKDANKVGPSLKGVFGRKAGSVAGYSYSKAMSDAGAGGLVWNETTLPGFLASPRKTVPGTRMAFFGLTNQADIDDVIAYLKANP